MKLTESIIRMLGGVTQQQLRESLLNYPMLGAIDTAEPGWRKLSAEPTRDLLPLAQERMIEIAAYLYESNPTAGRMIELTRDFVLGEGVEVAGAHPDVQAVIDGFWRDPVNDMDCKLDQKVLELGLFGEQIWPAFVSNNSGRVRLGYVDPAMVEQIIPDPENVEVLVGIKCKTYDGRPGKTYRIILDAAEADMLSPAGRALRNRFNDGQAFYFSVNRLSNSTRGRSDILSLIDWLDGYEEMMFGAMENTDLLTSFIWDVKLEGMTEEQIQAYAAKQRPPKRGSVRYHNQAVTWEAVAPDLKAQDIARHAKTFLAHIGARRGFPIHWLGTADDVNVATAKEMGVPTLKSLSNRQRAVVGMVRKVIRFAIQRAVDAGMLGAEVSKFDGEGNETGEMIASDQAFTVTAPELSTRDMGALSTALTQMTGGAALAVNSNLMSRETAIKLIATVAGMMGVEIDAKAELEKAQEQKRTGMDYSPEAIARARAEYGRARN